MVTIHGRVKRTSLSEFSSVRPSGLIAIRLEGEDELGWVRLTPGGAELMLATEQGQALRFREDEVRMVGRNAMGVYGIRLERGDRVASAEVVVPDADLLVVTENGYGKRTPLDEFRAQRRYGRGVLCVGGKPEIRGPVVAARVVCSGDEVTFITRDGMALRALVEDIPRMGRPARGANVMDLKEGDAIASVAVLEGERSEESGGEDAA
jgi:DNA gyrase subunit A